MELICCTTTGVFRCFAACEIKLGMDSAFVLSVRVSHSPWNKIEWLGFRRRIDCSGVSQPLNKIEWLNSAFVLMNIRGICFCQCFPLHGSALVSVSTFRVSHSLWNINGFVGFCKRFAADLVHDSSLRFVYVISFHFLL